MEHVIFYLWLVQAFAVNTEMGALSKRTIWIRMKRNSLLHSFYSLWIWFSLDDDSVSCSDESLQFFLTRGVSIFLRFKCPSEIEMAPTEQTWILKQREKFCFSIKCINFIIYLHRNKAEISLSWQSQQTNLVSPILLASPIRSYISRCIQKMEFWVTFVVP